MKQALRRFTLCVFLVCATASGSSAQYIFLDTTGDGISDFHDNVESPIDTVAVWLDTNHYPGGGSVATCPAGQELTLRSYQVALVASLYHGGTVLFDGWTNLIPELTFALGSYQDGGSFWTGYSMQAHSPSLPPGRYKLGELVVRSTGEGCDHQLLIVPELPPGPDMFTGFGSDCAGQLGDNWMRLGQDFLGYTNGGVICSGVNETTWGAIKQIYR